MFNNCIYSFADGDYVLLCNDKINKTGTYLINNKKNKITFMDSDNNESHSFKVDGDRLYL